MARREARNGLLGALALVALLLVGCSTFQSFEPRPMAEVAFLERAKTEERSGLRVTVAVPSRAEAAQVFGIDLAPGQIQPVWIRLENATEVPYVMMFGGVDPNYYSAREAAYKGHFLFRPFTNVRMDEYFYDYRLDPYVPPQGATEGFVFTNLKLGTKEVRVRLYGPQRVEDFEFFVQVPGFNADYHQVDWEALRRQTTTDFETEEGLRKALGRLPCCTTRRDGTGEGDPLNLVIIGSAEHLRRALIRSGWDETEVLTFGSAMRTLKAFFGGTYKYSPMSALYLFGRHQDAGFQKARDSIHERNHLRLWLSPLRFRGEDVWVGAISRDIGVYFTTRAWNLTTHAIDPAVDEARRYLREDFAIAGSIRRWGQVRGVGAATEDAPHRNLMNAPWWTDGNRMVMELSEEPVPLDEQGFFYWDWAGVGGEDLNERLQRLRR